MILCPRFIDDIKFSWSFFHFCLRVCPSSLSKIIRLLWFFMFNRKRNTELTTTNHYSIIKVYFFFKTYLSKSHFTNISTSYKRDLVNRWVILNMNKFVTSNWRFSTCSKFSWWPIGSFLQHCLSEINRSLSFRVFLSCIFPV